MSLIQEALNKAGNTIDPENMVEKKSPRAIFDEPRVQSQRQEKIVRHIQKEETEFESTKKENPEPAQEAKSTSPWVYAFGFLFLAAAIYFFFFRSATVASVESTKSSYQQTSEIGRETIVSPVIIKEDAPILKETKVTPVKEPIVQKVMNKIKSPKKTALPTGSLKAYGFSLTGITIAGEEKLALIDNQVVGVGDLLRDGVYVQEIRDRQVVLKKSGRELTLPLPR